MKSCRECGEYFPIEKYSRNYTNMHSGREYRQSVCRGCTREQDLARRTLGKQHARPESGRPCECCGRISKLFLDHDHSTLEFRGFICRECNSGIGYLGDDAAGVERALEYLIRARSFAQTIDTPIKKDGVRNIPARRPTGHADCQAMQTDIQWTIGFSGADEAAGHDAVRTGEFRQDLCCNTQEPRSSVQSPNPRRIPRFRRVGSRVLKRARGETLQERAVDARTDHGHVPLAGEPERGLPGTAPMQD